MEAICDWAIMLKMVRTRVSWIILLIAYINSIECRQIKKSIKSQVLSVDVISVHENDNGAIVAGEPCQLIVFGKYLPETVQFTFTKHAEITGGSCPQKDLTNPLQPYKYMLLSDYSKLFVYIPESVAKHMYGDIKVWLCYRTDKLSDWIHLGEKSKITIKNRTTGRRHLLRRSVIDVLTPPEVEITKDSSSGNLTSIFAESETKNSIASSFPDEMPTSLTRVDKEFSTSEKSVGDKVPSYNVKPKDNITSTSLVAEMQPTPAYRISQDKNNSSGVRLLGIRIEEDVQSEDSSIYIAAGREVSLRIFGYGLTDKVLIQFTAKKQEFGTDCDIATSDNFELLESGTEWATLKLQLPPMSSYQERWYVCVREDLDSRSVHQGTHKWLTIITYTIPLPVWIQGCLIGILLMLSGLFSGLNLGLMALDKTELQVVSNTGSAKERRYAKTIEPVRRHGNFLLCTLLLGNVLVNSTLTIVLDNLSTGLIAVILSTIGIVIFGEIIPQAVCSRHGLQIGAKTVWLVRVFMVITGIISWPISKILDKVLGEELGSTYNRERLKELIRVTQDRNDIKQEEQNIIYGALELHRKKASEVMTKIEDVFMLSVDDILDFNTINDIMQQGYSRVPIYETDRINVISVLFIKDLAFIDPDDNTPLRTLSQFYQNPCLFIFEDTTLDVVFKEFKEGNKGHMAFVQKINNDEDCDPYYELVGLITLEDVIEELIQEEIIDETDVFTDNRTKRRRKMLKRRDFKEFYQSNNISSNRRVQISPQMQMAAFQFLRTSVEPFKEGSLSEVILKKILTQDIIHIIKLSVKMPNPNEESCIYMQNSPADYFVLILEGQVEVTIGRENIVYESGPFSFFGLSALNATPPIGESSSVQNQLSRGSIQSLETAKYSFLPDYSVKASSDVTFLKITSHHYLAAKRAYLLQQSHKDPQAEENFVKELSKEIMSDEHLSLSYYDSADKAATVKANLLNGGGIHKCNGEEEITLRSSIRKTSDVGSTSPIKQQNTEDDNDTPPLSQSVEDC